MERTTFPFLEQCGAGGGYKILWSTPVQNTKYAYKVGTVQCTVLESSKILVLLAPGRVGTGRLRPIRIRFDVIMFTSPAASIHDDILSTSTRYSEYTT